MKEQDDLSDINDEIERLRQELTAIRAELDKLLKEQAMRDEIPPELREQW